MKKLIILSVIILGFQSYAQVKIPTFTLRKKQTLEQCLDKAQNLVEIPLERALARHEDRLAQCDLLPSNEVDSCVYMSEITYSATVEALFKWRSEMNLKCYLNAGIKI